MKSTPEYLMNKGVTQYAHQTSEEIVNDSECEAKLVHSTIINKFEHEYKYREYYTPYKMVLIIYNS